MQPRLRGLMKRGGNGRARLFSHRRWIAIEAVLVVGLLKDWLAGQVVASGLPGAGKVLFVMAVTVGVLGGLYFFVERLTAKSVARTHAAARGFPVALPVVLVHAAILGALFLMYARSFHIDLS